MIVFLLPPWKLSYLDDGNSNKYKKKKINKYGGYYFNTRSQSLSNQDLNNSHDYAITIKNKNNF